MTEPFAAPPLPAELTRAVKAHTDYRAVLYTHWGDANGSGAGQTVAMALGYNADDPNRAVGWETHEDTAQYFAVVEGEATVVLGATSDESLARSEPVSAAAGSKWEVPPGWWHDVRIAAGQRVKLLTIYHPPHHPPGTVDRTRADAEAREAAATPCQVCRRRRGIAMTRGAGLVVCGVACRNAAKAFTA